MQVRTLVVGSGVAGLGVAWALRDDPDVLVVDGQSHVGGNVHTVEVGGVAVDMGFIVCNEVTYPSLFDLFEHLGVTTAASDMSLSVQLPDGTAWGGSLTGLLGGGRWRHPRSWRRLAGILALPRRARALARPGVTVGQVRRQLWPVVVDDYLVPMVSAVWSSPDLDVEQMPLTTLVTFFDQHGLFDLTQRPRWRTVMGGARTWVAALRGEVAATFATDTPIVALAHADTGWRAHTGDGTHIDCERLVMATPPDVTHGLLSAALGPGSHDLLTRFRTTRNRAVLHGDTSVMPASRNLWSSWNVAAGDEVAVTYWMNSLQPLDTDRDLFVTLNPSRRLGQVHEVVDFTHPVLDAAAVRAHAHLSDLQGVADTWICGAWTGYGFHEDGLESGLAVGAALAAGPGPRRAADRPAAAVAR